MSELQVVVNQSLGVIDFNYEEIKANLSNMMDLYKDATVTEDGCVIAKKEVAGLRNIKKALNDRRIAVKKEYMKPYDEFEVKVKELTSLIDEPIELIETQVKKFEEKKKEEKKQKIEALYLELIGSMGEYIPLSKIYDSKWENASTTVKSIKEEIGQVVTSTQMAVQTIQGMASEAVPKALDIYKRDLSLANAITYINQFEQQKAEILAREEQKRKDEEERKRLAEIERVKEEERKRVAEEERIRKEAEEKAKKETEEKLLQIKEPEPVKEVKIPENVAVEDLVMAFDTEECGLPFTTSVSYVIVGTDEELCQVEMYMNSIGVSWERS